MAWALASIASAGIALMAVGGAHAQAGANTLHHVSASLVSQTRNVVAGRPLHLALRQQIEPGWHTYWSNPGDSGLPTTLEWVLPPGFRADPIEWPAPRRITVGPVVDYGYDHDVLLLVTIAPPPQLSPGAEVAFSAHASWLVCADTCIPEDADLSISLPAGAASEPDPRWTDAFAATRARLPLPNPFPTRASVDQDKLTLHVAAGDATRLGDVTFFPTDKDVLDDDAPQDVTADAAGLRLALARDQTKPLPTVLNGVLVFRDLAIAPDAPPEAIAISAPIAATASAESAALALIGALLFAFAGGLILNLMPCVLPVLAIKAFALVQHAGAAPRVARLQGLAYAAGVLVSFALVGALLIGLRVAGAEIGWGFQLQSPAFVVVMIYVLFAVGLNLSGVFSVGTRIAGVSGELAARAGYSGSFWTGALATLVATPCTAPFMAAALGYAITQPWYSSLAVFEAVGLGLALPYLLIAFSPGARRFLPKPGPWMERLRQALAFPIYATAVWLAFVLSVEAGATAVTAALAGLVLIGFAAWLYEAVRWNAGRWRSLGIGVAALSVLGALILVFATDGGVPVRTAGITGSGGVDWKPYSEADIDALRSEGRPIFVDVTAAWCITCKVNEQVALADPDVRTAFSEAGVAAVKADWTRQDAGITRMLEANGRAGVPLYLFYPKARTAGERRPAIILPQILTAASIIREIRSD